MKKTGYLDKRIKKTSRRKQWIALAVFVVLIFQAFLQIYAITFKPEQVPELISTDQIQPDSFVRVKITPNDIAKYVITTPNSSSSIKFIQAEYGEYVPIVVPANLPDNLTQYYGKVIMMSAAEKAGIVERLLEFPDVQEADAVAFVPMYYMLYETPPSFDPVFSFAIAIGLLWSAWLWIVSRGYKKKPWLHPVYRSLAREGGEAENLEQFESEIANRNVPEFSHLIVSEHWLFYNSYLKLKLRNISEIVCIFKTKTLTRSFLTRWATKKQDVVIGFSDKTQWSITFGRHGDVIETFKSIMKNRLPHIVCDENDKENGGAWAKNPNIILEKVLDNRFRAKNKKIVKNKKPVDENQPITNEQVEMQDEDQPVTKEQKETQNTAIIHDNPRESQAVEPPQQAGWTRRPSRRNQ